MGRIYQVQGNLLSVTDQGDFFQLRNGANRKAEILEIVVFQTSDTALAMNGIRFHRGISGSGGTGLTERRYDESDAVAQATAFSLATGDVGTLDLDVHRGWNILQEFVWVPTPQFQIPLQQSDHFGLSLLVADILTISCNVTWMEEGTS